MSTVAINGFEMHYESHGQGEPLLLLHGGMGIGNDWQHVFPSDPTGYRVVVPDLRGHGRSTHPTEAFTFERCARDVLALMDTLGLESAKAIGLSLGAKTLLHVATLAAARMEAMVLVSATPYFPPPLRTAAAQFTRESFTRLSDADRQTLGTRHVHGDEQILRLYDMMRSFATSKDDMAFTARELATITARTLVVHGDRDPYYPLEMALELYRGIPQSALWVVPHGGHGPVLGAIAPPFRTTALAFLSGELSG
jgi:pimeloyl-ACP methyl ester carboxylesterase